ncbi:AAA family ATPase [Acidithiobacillus albertensis]|uniref:AAA family ATPase n=1 Tax=Acidithiobacillus albertensis TaxID=119978 RepID=UPI001C075359|nr:AAA family ATPase [Acidithiobacillus albertensis]MBU2741877.1 AAA family ATPase [Acidithiobacillus albertensis]
MSDTATSAGAVGITSADLRAATGYRPDAATQQAIQAILAQSGKKSARALLVTGEPGTGKTSLAEALAAACQAQYYYVQLHPWSTVETFFADGENPGILMLTARSTQDDTVPMTLVCLDEMDKATTEFEAVFLDWLQTGQVPGKPGERFATRMDRLIVIITSNGMRPHTDALIRRCRRLRMERMPDEMAVSLAMERAGVSYETAKLAVEMARACERVEETTLSLQEIVHFLEECMAVCTSMEELEQAIYAWYVRRDKPQNILRSFEAKRVLPLLWEAVEKDLEQKGHGNNAEQ